jgi:large subunit ribosomal protein L15
MVKLNDLRDNPGATKEKIRVGRGIGSGKGKTGGRGVKGQKSRTGVRVKAFEGGQMPLYRRLPKRGFHNLFAKELNEVNLARLQQAVDAGRLDASKPVTQDALFEAGVLTRKKKDGVKILGRGELTTKLDLEVYAVSKAVSDAIEKIGGKVTLLAPKADAEAA